MLGYDLQISTITQRLITGHCEQGNVCLVVQMIKISLPPVQINTYQREYLMHCNTSRKVAVQIPDDVIGNFHWHKLSDRNVNLSSSQVLAEMNNRNIPLRGKGGWSVELVNLRHSCIENLEIWQNKHSRTLKACLGMCKDVLPLP